VAVQLRHREVESDLVAAFWRKVEEMVGAVQCLLDPRTAHSLPSNRCGQPVGESSHVSCRP
jgi:hypothetical protein